MANRIARRIRGLSVEVRIAALVSVTSLLGLVAFVSILTQMSEHMQTLVTLLGMSVGFYLKMIVFGVAAGVMIHQRGTSRLAVSVKWFFVAMSIQDAIVGTLYGTSWVDQFDGHTDISPFFRSVIRASGIESVVSVVAVGTYFIWVLSKRVRVLIEYEELDRKQDRKWFTE